MLEMSLNWQFKALSDFDPMTLYAVMQLRSQVFVVEQDCVFLDMDGKDQKAIHVFRMEKERCTHYARILGVGYYYPSHACIGRIVIAEEARGNGFGYALVAASVTACKQYFPNQPIKISAQKHLQKFYEKCGFEYRGEDYDEDGIPHCAMYFNA